jgi:tRNA(adenine34) deaminase
MGAALLEAEAAARVGEVPIGAVVACGEKIIARGYNTRERDKNPLHHAEIAVLEAAAHARGDWRLNDCDLYVTCEPCPMCLGALFQARVGRLFFGCSDEKRLSRAHGEVPNLLTSLIDARTTTLRRKSNNHTIDIRGGILENACADLLKKFFAGRRVTTGTW